MNTATINTTAVPSSTSVDPLDLNFTLQESIVPAIYTTIVIFVALFGNGTVLYASLKYNAMDIDRITLLFIQNLAVADTLVALIRGLPWTITLISGRWVLGEIYCFVSAQLNFVPGTANSLTVLAITVYKLRMITDPFFYFSKTTARIVVGGIWVFSMLPTITSLAYSSGSIFDADVGYCTSGVYDNDDAVIPIALLTIILSIIPLLSIIICNAVLCAIAIKKGRTMAKTNYKALVTVCCLSGLFIISWVPSIVVILVSTVNPDYPPILDSVSAYCYCFNLFGNPILYTITNKRFQGFVKKLLMRFFCGYRDRRVVAPDGGVPMIPLPTNSTASTVPISGVVANMVPTDNGPAIVPTDNGPATNEETIQKLQK